MVKLMATKLEKKVETAIQKWVNLLGISDYKFQVEYVDDKDLQGDYARIDTDEDTRIVGITLNRYRLTREPKEVERTIVHELLHTRLNELTEFMNNLIEQHLTNPKTRRMLKRQVGKLEHKVIVPITEALISQEK